MSWLDVKLLLGKEMRDQKFMLGKNKLLLYPGIATICFQTDINTLVDQILFQNIKQKGKENESKRKRTVFGAVRLSHSKRKEN